VLLLVIEGCHLLFTNHKIHFTLEVHKYQIVKLGNLFGKKLEERRWVATEALDRFAKGQHCKLKVDNLTVVNHELTIC